MGSIPQIGLGIVILGLAFIFGHYVNERTASRSERASQVLDDDEIVWQSNETIRELHEQLEQAAGQPAAPPTESDTQVPQSSMPIAGLGNRPVIRKPASDFAPPLPGGELSVPGPSERPLPPAVADTLPPLSQPHAAEPIAQPDFSALAATIRAQRNSEPVSSGFAPRESAVDNPAPLRPFGGQTESPSRMETSAPMAAGNRDGQQTIQRVVRPAEGLRPLDESSKQKFRIRSDQFVAYRTREGDTLQGVSIRYFGKPDFYLDIYLANRDVLSNPAQVPADVVLKIPVYEPPRDPLPGGNQ